MLVDKKYIEKYDVVIRIFFCYLLHIPDSQDNVGAKFVRKEKETRQKLPGLRTQFAATVATLMKEVVDLEAKVRRAQIEDTALTERENSRVRGCELIRNRR